MTDVVPIRETHHRYLQLLIQQGTPEEKQAAIETLTVMREAKLAHPEGTWEPMESLTLPQVLIERADRVGRRRHAEARKWRLRDKDGIMRSLDEEIRTVEGQYAACLILGLPFGDKLTHMSAKKVGNLGSNCSAHTPRYGNFNLLIRETEKRARRMFLMVWEGDHSYRCLGWGRAGEFMLPEYQREFVRDGHTAHPFIVPSSMLSPLRSWWP